MTNNVISTAFDQNGRAIRTIRSFVRRQRRLTKGQQYALDNYWPIMGVEYQAKLIDIDILFCRNALTVLEIGFGTGNSLVTMAHNNPQKNFLGIEVYLPGVSICLANAHAAKLSNFHVMCHDAVEVLRNMIPDGSLDTIQLFFPDPWQKKKHHKRRIIQNPFVNLVLSKLKVDGIFHVVTDWQSYAKHVLEIMNDISDCYHLSDENSYLQRPYTRLPTKFELRAQYLGHYIWDLMFKKK